MQFLTVFRKSDRMVIMTFRLKTLLTELDLIKNPDYDYVLTFDENIFEIDKVNSIMYLKENIKNVLKIKE